MERRDPLRRSETLRAVVEWLRAQTRPAPAVPAPVAEPRAAARIIKRLAVRGLARWTHRGWVPSPALRCVIPLARVEG